MHGANWTGRDDRDCGALAENWPALPSTVKGKVGRGRISTIKYLFFQDSTLAFKRGSLLLNADPLSVASDRTDDRE